MLSDGAFIAWVAILSVAQIVLSFMYFRDPSINEGLASIPTALAVGTLLVEFAIDRWGHRWRT